MIIIKMNNMNKFNQSNLLTPDIWNHYTISYKNKLLTNSRLKHSLLKFLKEITTKIENKMVILLLIIEYSDNTLVTLSNIQKVNYNEFKILFELFKEYINLEK